MLVHKEHKCLYDTLLPLANSCHSQDADVLRRLDRVELQYLQKPNVKDEEKPALSIGYNLGVCLNMVRTDNHLFNVIQREAELIKQNTLTLSISTTKEPDLN